MRLYSILVIKCFQIVDIETNETVDINETGELCVQGPQVMKGYLKNQSATEEMLEKDGWLHTGMKIAVISQSFVMAK